MESLGPPGPSVKGGLRPGRTTAARAAGPHPSRPASPYDSESAANAPEGAA